MVSLTEANIGREEADQRNQGEWQRKQAGEGGMGTLQLAMSGWLSCTKT